MAIIVPTGSPAWSRTASFANYGGSASKRNYLTRGVIDALTDLGAEEYSRAAADLAAAVRGAPFAVIRFTCNDTVPGAQTVHTALTMFGVRLTSYVADAPPGDFPGGARNGVGNVSFFFASSYTDEYGQISDFVPLSALATSSTAGTLATAQISGQDVFVEFTTSGSPTTDGSGTLVVW